MWRRSPIVDWAPVDGSEAPVLLDGRNRLDALASLGLLYETDDHHIGLKRWNGTKWSDRVGVNATAKMHRLAGAKIHH